MQDAIDEVQAQFNGNAEAEIIVNFLKNIEGGLIKGI